MIIERLFLMKNKISVMLVEYTDVTDVFLVQRT
nr:MAG TPA: hypothetical protein [Caudoviricetes sp.]